MNQQVIEKMRADFARVAAVRKEKGDWTEAEEREIGLAIKAAVDAGDEDMVASWALWLADLAAAIAAWDLIVRGSMARMRHQAEVEKAKREGVSSGR